MCIRDRYMGEMESPKYQSSTPIRLHDQMAQPASSLLPEGLSPRPSERAQQSHRPLLTENILTTDADEARALITHRSLIPDVEVGGALAANFYFSRWKLAEISSLIFSVTLFFVSIFQYEAQFEDVDSSVEIALLAMMTCFAVILVSFRIYRYNAMMTFYKSQKIYPRHATLHNTGHLWLLICEILLAIPHPNLITSVHSLCQRSLQSFTTPTKYFHRSNGSWTF
eukprot:TRINITY_DN3996_c0_g1_i8.p1 TRINITY_DN3996_c0_g1~~TRINITY_DN3996_c0_g1_i8.p1  ORF type:complete len:244 (+),score=31.87 TRINITY_DN3996_c0_g1_i8:60-734(+)